MEYFAGIDVSLEASSVCVVDAAGDIIREGKVATTPAALARFLTGSGVAFARIGFEAGPLAPWLFEGLMAAGLPVVCIETRRMKVFTSASPVKTDRKDAQAIGQAMRMGFFRAVHMKTRASLEARLMLTNRSLVLRQRLQLQNTIRGTLKGFGLKLGAASQGHFVAKIRLLIADRLVLQAAIERLARLGPRHRQANQPQARQGGARPSPRHRAASHVADRRSLPLAAHRPRVRRASPP